MLRDRLAPLIQSVLHKYGYHLRKLDKDVDLRDAFGEQVRLLKDSSVRVIFDVGAADGRTSIHYHEIFPEARIHAFEPFGQHLKKLRLVAQKNPKIQVHEVAASNANGSATFYCTSGEYSNSLCVPNDNTGSQFDKHLKVKDVIQVTTRTIDSICQESGIDKIDILKMDIQGAELHALKGAEKLLQDKKVRLIYTEVSFMPIYSDGVLFYQLSDYLAKFGYELFNIYDIKHNQKGRLAWADAIFLPNPT
jgi:FkbM family methyltransferase